MTCTSGGDALGLVVFVVLALAGQRGWAQGALVRALEQMLVRLQPGSYAIIVTRCLRQIVDRFNRNLQVPQGPGGLSSTSTTQEASCLYERK